MNKKTNKKFVLSKVRIVSITYLIVMYAVIIMTSTYAYQEFSINNNNSSGTAGCNNFIVSYTGQNLTASSINTSEDYTEGAKATVTLSKNSSCKLFTEANIYIKTNTSTTAPISTTEALKYKIFNGSSQISEGIVNAKNDLLVATVPLTDTATTYIVYLYIDSSLSGGEYTGTTYSGFVHATSTQTSTIEGNYLVTFNQNNGDSIVLNKIVTKGQPYGWLPTPEKEGYTFTGWKLSSTNITSTTNVTQSAAHTLVAQWTPATYTVSFNANGGSVGTTSKTVTYGSTYGTLPTPTYSGKTFKGWSLAPKDYQQVEYIKSTGTQYINTNTPLFNYENHEIIIDFTPTQLYNYNTIFGNTYDANTYEGWIYSNGQLSARYNSVLYGNNNTVSANTRYLLDLKKNGTTLSKSTNGSSNGSKTATTKLTDESLLLFLSGSDYGKYELYNCKLYADAKLKRDFIPVIFSGTQAGLYDMVNKEFISNSGTGEFAVGSNVYVTSSTTVNQEKNHTLTAVWE